MLLAPKTKKGENKMKTIKKVILTILIITLVVIMTGEIEDLSLWWIQPLAAIILCVIAKIAFGGKYVRD